MMEDDVEDRFLLGVAGHRTQHMQHHLAQCSKRIATGCGDDFIEHGLHRQEHPVTHRLKQCALVLEMPVDRAARHAGGTGDIVQCGARDALVDEFALGRIQ